jgi:molecular chaperone GrpE
MGLSQSSTVPRDYHETQMRTVLDRAERRKRELTDTWQTRYDTLDADFETAKQAGGAAALLAGAAIAGLVQSRRRGARALHEMEKTLAGSMHRMKDLERALARDVKAARQKGVTALSKDLFGVVDTLELASDAAARDAATPVAIAEGVGMVRGSFLKVLENHGVRAIEASVGDKFDPTLHDADRRLPLVEGATHNTLANVRVAGYEFGEEERVLLRACKVDVFVDDGKSSSQ